MLAYGRTSGSYESFASDCEVLFLLICTQHHLHKDCSTCERESDVFNRMVQPMTAKGFRQSVLNLHCDCLPTLISLIAQPGHDSRQLLLEVPHILR